MGFGPGRSVARVTVTLEYVDGRVEYRTFSRDGSIKSLKDRLRKRFKTDPNVAHVGMGNGVYEYYYGAH